MKTSPSQIEFWLRLQKNLSLEKFIEKNVIEKYRSGFILLEWKCRKLQMEMVCYIQLLGYEKIRLLVIEATIENMLWG